MSSFSIHTLGCGSAKPSLRHNPSSTVINFRENLFMIDCGEGTQLEMQRQHLKFSRLRHIFLTHLHGDHCFGLPGLICSQSLINKGGHITIHTFKEGIDMFRHILNYFNKDSAVEVEFHEIQVEEAVIYEDKAIIVRTIPLKHRVPAVGYIFEEKPKLRHIKRDMVDFHKVPVSQMKAIKEGKPFIKADGTIIPAEMLTSPATPSFSYAHIGDTAYIPGIAAKIGPVDLLYHETTYLEEHRNEAADRGHSTAREAAIVARDAGAKRLLTGHYSSRYRNENLFVKEASEIFQNTILNREGLIISLDRLE